MALVALAHTLKLKEPLLANYTDSETLWLVGQEDPGHEIVTYVRKVLINNE